MTDDEFSTELDQLYQHATRILAAQPDPQLIITWLHAMWGPMP